jgi:hypothetical protein
MGQLLMGKGVNATVVFMDTKFTITKVI